MKNINSKKMHISCESSPTFYTSCIRRRYIGIRHCSDHNIVIRLTPFYPNPLTHKESHYVLDINTQISKTLSFLEIRDTQIHYDNYFSFSGKAMFDWYVFDGGFDGFERLKNNYKKTISFYLKKNDINIFDRIKVLRLLRHSINFIENCKLVNLIQ